MGRRGPKWHKPRTALAVSLGFAAWVAAGAVMFREPEMVAFAAICGGAGLVTYGTDCAVHWFLDGQARPPEVLRADVLWTSSLVFIGLVVGLAAPLYV